MMLCGSLGAAIVNFFFSCFVDRTAHMTRRTNFKKKTHLESSKWEDMVSMKQQRLAQNAAIHDAQAHGHGTSDSALTASQTTQSTNTPEPKSTSLSTYHSSANNTLEVGPTAAVNTTGGGDIGEVGGGSKKRHRFKKNTSDGGVAGVDEDTFEGTRNTSNDPAEKRRRCMSQDKRANEQEKRKARRKAMKTVTNERTLRFGEFSFGFEITKLTKIRFCLLK